MAYCTLAELKLQIGITSTSDDTMLSSLIADAQALIDAQCRRTFEAASDTARTFDAVRNVRGRLLMLDADLAQITSITNGDGTTVSTSQYTTEPRNATPWWGIRLLSSSGISWTYSTDPEDAITITGRWAYSVTPSANVTQATIRLAAWMYRQKDTSKDSGDKVMLGAFGPVVLPSRLPSDVLDLLPPAKEV